MKKYLSNLFIIFIPVIICIAVFLLPVGWQELLVQNINALNWWNWFTYIFVHENLTHILFNLIMYVASIFIAFVIIPKKDKDKFYVPFLFMIVLVPLISLLLTLLLRDSNLFPKQLINSRGFSGVSSAASGFLVFSIARRIQFLLKQESNKSLLLNLCKFKHNFKLTFFSFFYIYPFIILMPDCFLSYLGGFVL